MQLSDITHSHVFAVNLLVACSCGTKLQSLQEVTTVIFAGGCKQMAKVKMISNETFKLCATIAVSTACEKCKIKNMENRNATCAQSKSVDASRCVNRGQHSPADVQFYIVTPQQVVEYFTFFFSQFSPVESRTAGVSRQHSGRPPPPAEN